jgi:hypothetical protein
MSTETSETEKRGPGRPKGNTISLDNFGFPNEGEGEFFSDLDLMDQLNDIIGGFIPEQIPFTVTLNKSNPITKKWEQMERWEQQMPPSSHELGVTHGSGYYSVIINWRHKNVPGIKKIFFTLGINYDRLKRESEKSNNPVSSVGNSGNDDFKSMMMMMMKTSQEEAKRSQETVQALLTGMVGMMTAVMSRPAQEYRESISDKLIPGLIASLADRGAASHKAMIEVFQDGVKTGVQTSGGNATMEKDGIDYTAIINMAIDKLPDVLNSIFSPKINRSILMENKNFKTILENPELKEEFLRKAKEAHGEEMLKKAIEKAGVSDLVNGTTKPEIPKVINL